MTPKDFFDSIRGSWGRRAEIDKELRAGMVHDSRFSDHAEKNKINPILVIVVSIVLSMGGFAFSLFGLDSINLNTRIIKLAFTTGGSIYGLSIAHFAILSLIFTYAWYKTFANSAIMVHHKIIQGWSKFFVTLATSSSLASFVLILFTGKDSLQLFSMLSGCLLLAGFASAAAFSFNLSSIIFGKREQIRSNLNCTDFSDRFVADLEKGDSHSTDNKWRIDYINELSNFKNCDTLMLGWLLSNTVIFIAIALYLSLWVNDNPYSSYSTFQKMSSDGGAPYSGWAFTSDHLYFFVIVIMGLVAGGLRTKLDPKTYSDEVYVLNTFVDTIGGGGVPRPDHLTSEANDRETIAETVGTEAGETSARSSLMASTTSIMKIVRFWDSFMAAILAGVFSQSIFQAIIVFCFLTFSFAINDAFDFLSGKDDKCHPNRPLPQRQIAVPQVMAVAVVLSFIPISMTVVFQHDALPIILSCFVGSVLYSFALKRYAPSIATVGWCVLVSVIFLFQAEKGLEYYVIFVAYFYAREILLDLRDVHADNVHCYTPSLPSLIGENRTILVSFFMLNITFGVSFYVGNMALSLAAAASLAIFIVAYYKTQDARQISYCIRAFFPFVVFM